MPPGFGERELQQGLVVATASVLRGGESERVPRLCVEDFAMRSSEPITISSAGRDCVIGVDMPRANPH